MNRLSSSHTPADGRTDRRLAVAALIVLGTWLILITRLFYLQVVEGDRYRVSAERNSVRTRRVEATRGIILDRSGTILVDSRPSFDVGVVPHETRDLKRTLQRVALLTGLDGESLVDRWGAPRGRERFRTQIVGRDLGRNAMARVEARLWALPGVHPRVGPVRAYSFGDSASHVLGRLGEINQDKLELDRYQGYRRGDTIGITGIEALLDRELRGRDGGRNLLVDAHGRELELLSEIEPQPGQNVRLNLDHRLQRVAEEGLEQLGKSGAVVALDPRNGQVLALVSRPRFDPNRFAVGLESGEWAALQNDPSKPLNNLAIEGVFPPGSTYKVVTLIAGLEEKVITPQTEVTCVGLYRLGTGRYRCWKRGGHGVVRAHRALVESCDVFFYRTGRELGVERLADYARKLGLGRPTGIELPRESGGLVPDGAWKERRFGERWIEGETISVSIGQGFNLWTPIQLAQLYGALGNRGERYRPYLIRQTEDPYGTILDEREPHKLDDVPISKETLDFVRGALRGVVHDPHGTGYAMRRLPGGVESAGKTGTAQVVRQTIDTEEEDLAEEHRDHAWFATFAPAENPRIVVAVLVANGGHGSSAAAPIAAQVVTEFLNNEGKLHARR